MEATPSFRVGAQQPATDFMFDVGRRVSIAAIALASVWLVVTVMANLTVGAMPSDPALHTAWDLFGNELAVAFVSVSLALAYLAHRLQHRPELVLRLGLGYEVVGAFAVAALSQWNAPLVGRGISWNCVAILIFPAFVPARPLPTLLTSVTAASAEPIVYLLARMAGVAEPPMPGAMAIWMFLPTYICAALAVVPASIVRRLGQAAKEAHELGSYRLGELLGRGGMGEVYRASHRLLARPAAVKMISSEQLGASDPGMRNLLSERFHREAAAAASLRSPHTIDLYDFGVAADGTMYYAMELLDGVDFQSLVLRHGPLEPARAVHLLRQACLSLAEAHHRGFVHRDIKPSNLMTCRMGTQVDFVKVLDFGLVKVETRVEASLTGADVAAGTPEYMAPEAIDGVATVDHRADLYALGCVAYWLLCGRPVFQGHSALSVLLKHGSQAPPPLTGTVAPVPPALEAVVMRCLAKEPDERFADAQGLERALASSVAADAWSPAASDAWWEAHRPER
jgi:serine/threonine-protein kinase